jgi:hypothetical protein
LVSIAIGFIGALIGSRIAVRSACRNGSPLSTAAIPILGGFSARHTTVVIGLLAARGNTPSKCSTRTVTNAAQHFIKNGANPGRRQKTVTRARRPVY